MLKKTNKKGFTLIELIVVVAIMAVLVALLAPNVLKYLEKSKVGKDINSLDSVRLAVEAELMDERLSLYTTDVDGDGIAGRTLASLDADGASADDQLLYTRLFEGDEVLADGFDSDEIFVSRVAAGAEVEIK